MKKKTKKMLGICLVIVLVAALSGTYYWFREKPVEGNKEIVIEVVDSKGIETQYELKTDAEFLSQAMDEADGLEYNGEEGPYGFSVSVVNGESGVYETDGAYWAFYVNGEYCNYGIDSQPVNDGDEFSIVYTKA